MIGIPIGRHAQNDDVLRTMALQIKYVNSACKHRTNPEKCVIQFGLFILLLIVFDGIHLQVHPI